MAGKLTVPSFPVKLVLEREIGHAHSARDALLLIGENWDELPALELVSGHYEFELDSHRFLVHIVPLDQIMVPDEIFGHSVKIESE